MDLGLHGFRKYRDPAGVAYGARQGTARVSSASTASSTSAVASTLETSTPPAGHGGPAKTTVADWPGPSPSGAASGRRRPSTASATENDGAAERPALSTVTTYERVSA